ncbi:MAG: DEAD/DEAH box helicase [Pseudoflavonifractor sp.]
MTEATEVKFTDLSLGEPLEKAVEEMGFEIATPVQAEAIPLIRTGVDVIAKSQTGTGKTVAFAIPALESIDTTESKPTIQVIILCPTRELAQQAGEEIRKLAKYLPGIHPAEVFGGADMERQFIRLRRANIVVGTPGRVMDHMRRKTIRLDNLKMIILDEADEMLKMGFKEDIETILQDASAEHQTVLFSATMPPAILSITRQFQKNPKMIEINKSQVTIENIAQSFVDVPTAQKTEALEVLLRYHRPNRALIFCNTKHMVDELCEKLGHKGFAVEGIHGDLKQSQRTSVMNSFKGGKTALLIATDVAARGIDVNDIDYVFNYDIPLKTEYYVHRIGRTGRAGKSGCSITLCCGKRQVGLVRNIGREVKSDIKEDKLPGAEDIRALDHDRKLTVVETAIAGEVAAEYTAMVQTLIERGHTAEEIAAALLQMQFPPQDDIPVVKAPRREYVEHDAFRRGGYQSRSGYKAGGDKPRGDYRSDYKPKSDYKPRPKKEYTPVGEFNPAPKPKRDYSPKGEFNPAVKPMKREAVSKEAFFATQRKNKRPADKGPDPVRHKKTETD